MRIKIIIFPFFIIIILILGIGYIKPDWDVVQMKKAEIAANEVQKAKIETSIANINALTRSLDAGYEMEQFAYRYLPKTLDQEPVIDAFNFLVNQSGLSVVEMALEEPTEIVAVEEPLLDPAASNWVAGGGALETAEMAVPPAPPVTVRTFVLTGKVTGSYGNIKTFFDKLSRIERFQKIHLFSIAANEANATDGTVASDALVGTFEAEFGYLPPKPVASALGMPIFTQSNFDFLNLERLRTQLTSSLPALEKGETGRPNPFQ